MQFLLVKHTRTEEREGRDGRIRPKKVVTWDIIDDDRLVAEYATKREAEKRLAQLEA
jgi:hypothetical protein